MAVDPQRRSNLWLGVLVGVLVFVLTVAAMLAFDQLRDDSPPLPSPREVRQAEQQREAERRAIREADIREITRRLNVAQEPSSAEQRRVLNRALRRLTVRQRQRLLNALLRVATARQKRLLFGTSSRRIEPSPARQLAPIPRSVRPSAPPPPAVATPPRVGVPPALTPVTQRPRDDADDDRDDDDDDRDRERDRDRDRDRGDRRDGE